MPIEKILQAGGWFFLSRDIFFGVIALGGYLVGGYVFEARFEEYSR